MPMQRWFNIITNRIAGLGKAQPRLLFSREKSHCVARTQLAQEGGVLLAARRQVLLRKLQRLLRAALAHQLDQALLLQVERQLVLLLQDLRRAAPKS